MFCQCITCFLRCRVSFGSVGTKASQLELCLLQEVLTLTLFARYAGAISWSGSAKIAALPFALPYIILIGKLFSSLEFGIFGYIEMQWSLTMAVVFELDAKAIVDLLKKDEQSCNSNVNIVADCRKGLREIPMVWPPTYCQGRSLCRIPSPTNFTIHGLWPSDTTKYGTIQCPAGNLNLGSITSLMNRLGLEWPDLNGNNIRFWTCQYKKHGMCSADQLDAYSYFETTLKLKNSVDPLQYMAEAYIKPSNQVVYNAKYIFAAIWKKTRVKPRLWCYGRLRVKTLLEISICVDYSAGNFIDCPPTLLNDKHRNCFDYGTAGVSLPLPSRYRRHLPQEHHTLTNFSIGQNCPNEPVVEFNI
ncbi:hypothetical protein CMV_015568 [Castanea mollissima]|uniref:Uncharacterized protein n=1 Tax=Castanea mollissima TaxID=60419 RepID=A0A8J4R510_9ROSI|nr:hypothetical protein CMV_015568 [Castanea mollissima]